MATKLTTAVLLVNLGTPDAATPSAVKRFLSEFLHDRRVIKLTRWIWCPLLHFLVLPLRSKRVAQLYQSIWWEEGSPMRVVTERQAKALSHALGDDYCVYWAMRYGNPSMEAAALEIIAAGHEHCIILPLYPQHSDTTTTSVKDKWQALARKYTLPQTTWVEAYYQDNDYIEALVQSIQAHWSAHGKGEKLLFSFHGIPERYVKDGDPYVIHSLETGRRVAAKLGLSGDDYQIAFQSRFGRAKWVEPYTDKVVEQWAGQNVKQVDVISPSFSADCLETLEELQKTTAEQFYEAGGERLAYIPALNDQPEHIALMKKLCLSAVVSSS